MSLILIAIIALIALAIIGSNHSGCRSSTLSNVICPLMGIVGCFAFIAYMVMGFHWISAGYKKDIINREYETNYTQAEVFYASDVINTIRELNRNRFEINGNIAKEKDSEK